MWLVQPELMCREHLLGEHVEMHMISGVIKRGMSIDGYLNNKLIEPGLIKKRHDELVVEMEARGYRHNSEIPLSQVEIERLVEHYGQGYVDRFGSFTELHRRCEKCRERMEGK